MNCCKLLSFVRIERKRSLENENFENLFKKFSCTRKFNLNLTIITFYYFRENKIIFLFYFYIRYKISFHY